jgi:hypothetical protein
MTAPFATGKAVTFRAGLLPARAFAVRAMAVAAVTLAAFIVVQLDGGSPNVLNHLAYAAIALGSYLYGWRGGVVIAAVNGVLLGPVPILIGLPSTDTIDTMVVRSAAYLAVGFLIGSLFERTARTARVAVETARRLDRRHRDSIVAFARAAEAKDEETGEHIVRVQVVAERLALGTGMDRPAAEDLGWAAMLHDIGKLHVPDQILTKPGPLSPQEWQIMRRHPAWGAEILPTGHSFEAARRIALWHHENFDGTGYPDGLDREAIPLDARIVRVADAFDAMTSNRPYARRRSIEEALEELDRYAGTHFDPEIVRLVIHLMRSDTTITGELARLRSIRANG